MRPAPIPDTAVWEGARRMVIAPPDGELTHPEIASVEVVADIVRGDQVRLSARCLLEPGDLEKLQAGGHVWVTFYGGLIVPFSVDVTGPTE